MNYRTRSSVARWLGALIAALLPTLRWVAPLLVVTTLAACGSSAEPAIPTREPAPTFTPTAEIQAPGASVDPAVAAAAATAAAEAAAATAAAAAPTTPPEQAAAPTEAPTVAPTATTAQAAEAVITTQINVRGGPGTNYNILGTANPGESYPITGKNNDGTWWQINYNGQQGWVLGELITSQNTQAVAIAPNIPAPPPTATPAPVPPTAVPQPTQPPAEQPTAAPPPASDNFPFSLGSTESCAPNAGNTYFSGFVRDANNNLMNGVCIHVAFYGPRTTKCSGCNGVGDGIWGFNPFGGPAPAGTPIEIFVVPCPSTEMPFGGQTEQSGFGDLTPQSPKWTRTIQSSEQCTGITFYKK